MQASSGDYLSVDLLVQFTLMNQFLFTGQGGRALGSKLVRK
jgi:hypothetical protein